MNRRQFLFRTLPAIAATMALDPEALLWAPTKTIFIPTTVRVATWDEIDAVMMRHIPILVDRFYEPSSLYKLLRNKEMQSYEGGRRIVQSITMAESSISLV